ncbi:MAG: hypothetical protein AB8E82_16865 [Aureispira sp.]
MKLVLKALLLLVMISSVSCRKQYSCDEGLFALEASSYQLMETEIKGLQDGLHDADIDGQLVKVMVRQGRAQWLMPALEEGAYSMTFPENAAAAPIQILIKNMPLVDDAEAYLLGFMQEVDLGLTETQITAMSDAEQVPYAQFLQVNRAEIIKRIANVAPEPKAAALSLGVNQSVSISVHSKNLWNGSGVQVKAGEVYEIRASGTWNDWYINTDANGYSNWYLGLVGFLKRVPSENYFKLIAAVNRQRKYAVGKSASIRVTESGHLEFFANDVLTFYWNNSGSVYVTITRVA